MRNGIEMNSILMKERNVLKALKDLRTVAGNMNYRDRNIILSSTGNILKSVGTYVDTAVGIVTDDKYRMSNEDRRKYLQEIDRSLDTYLSIIQQKRTAIVQQKIMDNRLKTQNNSLENALNHQNQAQNELIRKSKRK